MISSGERSMKLLQILFISSILLAILIFPFTNGLTNQTQTEVEDTSNESELTKSGSKVLKSIHNPNDKVKVKSNPFWIKSGAVHGNKHRQKFRKRRTQWKKAFKKFWRWYSGKLLKKQRRKMRRKMKQKINTKPNTKDISWEYFREKNGLQ